MSQKQKSRRPHISSSFCCIDLKHNYYGLHAKIVDVKLLKKLAQHFSALGVNTAANFSAEEQVSNYSEHDHKKFS